MKVSDKILNKAISIKFLHTSFHPIDVFIFRYLYWSEWGGQPKISRISMDGKAETRRVLIDKEIVWPNALTIDYVQEILWWADAKLEKIERSNMDGTNRQVFIERNVGAPYSIAVSTNHVYWSNWNNGRIERVEKDSWGRSRVQSHSFSHYAFAITLIDGKKHQAGMHNALLFFHGVPYMFYLYIRGLETLEKLIQLFLEFN
jgi:hypothetical protein